MTRGGRPIGPPPGTSIIAAGMTPMPTMCACGYQLCHKRNHGFFRERKPGKKVRAVVFWWSPYRCWTWCPVIGGEPVDRSAHLGHFDTLQLAYAEARAYTCGEYREAGSR